MTRKPYEPPAIDESAPFETQWSHEGACDLPGSLCKPTDVCHRCGHAAGVHPNYPKRAPDVAPPSPTPRETVADVTAHLVAHLEKTIHDERIARATHTLELLDVAVAKREAAEGALEECLVLLREVPLWDDLTRLRLFKATTGALGGGTGHPHRCVCQDAPDAYPGTPHTHYEEPPHACARCTECRKYRPAVVMGPTIDWRARVAALLAKSEAGR